MAAVIKVAKEAPIKALNPNKDKSPLRSGAITPIPPI